MQRWLETIWRKKIESNKRFWANKKKTNAGDEAKKETNRE